LTAAASGVPTPCVPAVVAPWAPGSPTVMLANFPALNNSSKAVCTIGGAISINFAGQATVNVP
ncbi:MAG: PAAR-like protein, partial [Cyanobacteria bacterium J06607_6]